MSSRVVASKAQSGLETLAPLLAESRAQVLRREVELVRRVTAPGAPSVIIFGAGFLGRRLRAALADVGAPPVAFADNDPRLWGSCVDGTPAISPAEAAARYGPEGLFIVAAWNPGHAFAGTARHLRAGGCRAVVSWIPLAWGLTAAELLPHYAAGYPSSVLAAAADVARVASMWADSASTDEFVRQTRWRLSGDFADLADPMPDQYFPPDLLTLRPNEAFVDCGAFDGDTLREVVARCPGFGSVVAFEPDATNFESLERCVAKLGKRGGRVGLHRAATDRRSGVRRFGGAGTSGALVDAPAGAVIGDDAGRGSVLCVSLDEVLDDVPVTFIKIDVEGGEADTLRGAERLLRERRPVIAVSAYHHQADLWELPALLAELTEGDYHFHLRAHGPDAWECVLYGIPAERSRP